MWKLTVTLIISFFFQDLKAYDKLCESIWINKLKKLEFTDTEKRMLCGDGKVRAYQYIPVYEARFFLKGFLQSRGYLTPEFEIKDETLYVNPGSVSEVSKISVESAEPKIKKEIKTKLRRLYDDKVLNTSLLDSIEGDALTILKQNGYPCAGVRTEADVTTDRVTVFLEDLKHYNFGEIEKEEIEGLRKNALNRFYPFDANQEFNQELLLLAEKRMARAEVVQGTYFIRRCSEDDFSLYQGFIQGPPRTIRFGVGASTEVGPMVRFRWSNNRYKSMASQLSANLQASFRTQSLTLTADSFFWHGQPRRSLFSQFEIVRESQIDYEQLVVRAEPHMKWTRDSEDFHKIYIFGPTYEAGTFHSKQTTETRSFSTGAIESSFQWVSHDYELFDIHPQEGNVFGISLDFRHPSFGFPAQLLKIESSAVHIDQLSTWGRGLIIGAVRLDMGTTSVTDDLSLRSLPPTVKFFGGGSDDVRGFQLRTLPQNDGLGALSKAVLKLELRRTYLFIETLEGFTFLDVGQFGPESWDLEEKRYYSPGLGLRWISPFGLVQGYAARAYTSEPFADQGNLFYAGIGGVF